MCLFNDRRILTHTCKTFKNSNVSISNPKLPSTINNTKSAIFPRSIIEEISFGHSIKVRRRFFPLTTVIGPPTSVNVCFVYFLIKDYTMKRINNHYFN